MNKFNHIKGVFVGSGSDGLNNAQVRDAIVKLTGKPKPNVLFLGTATYDLEGPREKQTTRFAEVGCQVKWLEMANRVPGEEEVKEAFEATDIIIVSGGNTLFACDRMKKLGVDKSLKASMDAGAVLTGGSAGAICWFDAGHSDSMDPATYKNSMLQQTNITDESQIGDQTVVKEWQYIRVPCLGFLPGLVAPHHDIKQSNGVLRCIDFDKMMLLHPGEQGICIDHWAALILNGDGSYEILSLDDKKGSLMPDDTQSLDQSGKPWVWLKDVQNGEVKQRKCPNQGQIDEILKIASEIIEDPLVELCRQQNPSD